MTSKLTLNQYLDSWAGGDTSRVDVASIILNLARGGISLSRVISRHNLTQSGDTQKPLDKKAQHIFEQALASAPVSFLASEEKAELVEIDSAAACVVAIDPLHGSMNVETNMSIGTIFSILAVSVDHLYEENLGDRQSAAGFLLYGPQTMLVLTCGNGTEIFSLDWDDEQFYHCKETASIPPGKREFAINTSNYRFWDSAIRHFIDDCYSGEDGPLGVDFNMRWNASLVAEAFRILLRGGVFLYPADSRAGYENGRLRHFYEALPLAFIVEQAGGSATDGDKRIMEIPLTSIHQRTPLIFGSKDMVSDVVEYISVDPAENTRYPLFQTRGLLRS